MSLKTGLLEKRQNERKDATWEVIYQTINTDEAKELRQRFSTQGPAPERNDDSDFAPAVTSDWSDSGLCMMTGQALKPGSNLIIYLQHPTQPSLVLVAEVVHNAVVEHPLSCVYRTGVRITGVNPQDWRQFTKTGGE